MTSAIVEQRIQPMANAVATDRAKTVHEWAAGATVGEKNFDADLWLLCAAGSHHFALPMANVIETMRMLPVETVVGAPPLVCGLSVIRGAAVPVIDTVRLFGGESAHYERLVTVRTGERTVAFAASAVFTVQSIKDSGRERLPPLLRDAHTIAAIARLDQELVFFLHAARALPDDFRVDDDAGSEGP